MAGNLLGQVKAGIAKALQIASDGEAFHDLPDCDLLQHLQILSIKAANPSQITNLITRYIMNGNVQFDPVDFLIRDEKQQKKTVLKATLVAGRGLEVKNMSGKAMFTVTLPNHSTEMIGKIVHPSGATLYKVRDDGLEINGHNYSVLRTDTPSPPYMLVERVMFSLQAVLKKAKLINTDAVYWFKRADGSVLGYVRPKLVVSSSTLVVKFSSTALDVQSRAAMLGVSLLFQLLEAVPELGKILSVSIQTSLASPNHTATTATSASLSQRRNPANQ